jgi:hypothetical protein
MKACHAITGVKPQSATCKGDYTIFIATHDGEKKRLQQKY